MLTIQINTEIDVAYCILIYGAFLADSDKGNFICDSVKKSTENNSVKPDIKLPFGESRVSYQNNIIIIKYERKHNPVGLSHGAVYFKDLYISTAADNPKELLSKFINSAREYCRPNQPGWVTTKVLKNGYWSYLSKLPIRSMDTIYLENTVKDSFIKDIKEFISSEQVYKDYGIPYKRNYLLSGPPGTGKTSLIFAIASMLESSISIVNFGPNVDDSIFMTAISNMSENSILLLEDVDALFVERKHNDNHKSMISFSGILNTLDGIGRANRQITFMTSNYPDRLDPALVRPGRIDYVIEFTYATEEQKQQMFNKFLPKQGKYLGKFMSKIKSWDCTTAMLQQFFFTNRNCDNILEKMEELEKLVKPKPNKIIEGMYI